ncbi:MAG: hypothetical protein EOO56_12865 [Hymenobacter sp.]|nr:MAG: hypothetical protein EOO56_12865 [Hymenobacter sp.]
MKAAPQRIKKTPGGITLEVQVFLVPEGKQIVAYCPALELSTYGDSQEDAKGAFSEVLASFIQDTQAKGTLEKVLLELGWKLQQKPVVNYEPPAPSMDFLNAIGKSQQNFQTITQPMTLSFA